MYSYIIIFLAVVYFIYFICENYKENAKAEELLLKKRKQQKEDDLKLRFEIQDISESIKDIKVQMKELSNISELHKDINLIKSEISQMKSSCKRNTEELTAVIENLQTETSNLNERMQLNIHLQNKNSTGSVVKYIDLLNLNKTESGWLE